MYDTLRAVCRDRKSRETNLGQGNSIKGGKWHTGCCFRHIILPRKVNMIGYKPLGASHAINKFFLPAPAGARDVSWQS